MKGRFMKFKSALLCMFVLLIMSADALSMSYGRALSTATKRGHFYDVTTWDAKLIWRATFFSDEFREIYAKRETELKYLSPEDEKILMGNHQKKGAEGWEFFVCVYTKKPYKKITNDDGTFWNILLSSDDGNPVKPTSVESIPITPFYEVMYPFINRWSKGFKIVFPKIPLGNELELTLRSVVGSSTLKWKTNR